MKTRFHFSGKWDDYIRTLRQFTLDELLTKINEESTKILFKENKDQVNALKRVTVPIMNLATNQQMKDEVLVSAWQLIDLAYNAIVATNDYRGKTPTNEDLYLLCAETNALLEEREKLYLNDISGKPQFFLYLWGFTGEQFKMQGISSIFQNAARDLYILLGMPRTDDTFDIPEIIKKETGVSWIVLISALFLAWFAFTHDNSLKALKESVLWDDEFKQTDFEKVIERYTITYNEIRESSLKRQVLYTRPFIRTQRRSIIAVNSYLNLFIYEHCALWTLRDHYKKQNSGEFFNIFGSLFETYFRELLETYVEKSHYERIEENKKEERADWRIKLCKHSFLIEQKSAIVSLAAKQQESNYIDTEKFCKNTIIKALHQLETTEKALGDAKYIKIILLYEDYFIPEILDYVFQLSECDVENDHYYWIVTIDEMEKLLHMYKNDKHVFSKIIQEKICRETENSKNGKRLQILFSENKVVDNEYLKQEKIKQYAKAAENFIRRKLPHPTN